jgi:serine/threonine protein kinase
MAASIAVGLHPHVVGVLGEISHHSNETRGLNMGLLMPLISSDFMNLAQPPSLSSCTRDIYTQGLAFSLQELHSLALGIASAAEHLHACGILHGDLYAHNILHNSEGHGLLGDFGAASFLPTQDHGTSQALQRIEVRALGILLSELLVLCPNADGDAEQAIRSKFIELQQRCTQSDVSARPLFADVARALRVYMDVASSMS